MRALRFVLPVLVLLAAVAIPTAQAADEACLSPDSAFDPACVPEAAALHLARQACDYAYAPGCDLTAFAAPGYAVDADPNPDAPRQWMVGAVHEHSGYSDGDIRSVPRDYFSAARDGTNGMVLDFLFSSEHSDNASITPTTNAECLTGGPEAFVTCGHFTDNSFYWKWPATLKQATESSTDQFTGIRGFEWTNDVYNHMNVFFSTNFRNVKVDGSYLSMQRMWEWLQTPVTEGGGADGLVTFNHPGSNPKLSPFDGGLPHSEALGSTGIANWNGLAYVPEVDARVVGMEINGGEDIAYYVQALQNGWHIGAVAAEDHHGTSWASPSMHKTLVLTGGRTPQDYYWAFSQRRTVAVHNDLLSEGGTVPTVSFSADGGTHVLGARIDAAPGSTHTLEVSTTDLPAGARVALIGSEAGQAAPIPVGSDGVVSVTTDGDDWWFAVVCVGGDPSIPCGSDETYSMVTAPIWFE